MLNSLSNHQTLTSFTNENDLNCDDHYENNKENIKTDKISKSSYVNCKKNNQLNDSEIPSKEFKLQEQRDHLEPLSSLLFLCSDDYHDDTSPHQQRFVLLSTVDKIKGISWLKFAKQDMILRVKDRSFTRERLLIIQLNKKVEKLRFSILTGSLPNQQQYHYHNGVTVASNNVYLDGNPVHFNQLMNGNPDNVWYHQNNSCINHEHYVNKFDHIHMHPNRMVLDNYNKNKDSIIMNANVVADRPSTFNIDGSLKFCTSLTFPSSPKETMFSDDHQSGNLLPIMIDNQEAFNKSANQSTREINHFSNHFSNSPFQFFLPCDFSVCSIDQLPSSSSTSYSSSSSCSNVPSHPLNNLSLHYSDYPLLSNLGHTNNLHNSLIHPNTWGTSDFSSMLPSNVNSTIDWLLTEPVEPNCDSSVVKRNVDDPLDHYNVAVKRRLVSTS